MKLTNRKIATILREIAREVEKGKPTLYLSGLTEYEFTCNRVFGAVSRVTGGNTSAAGEIEDRYYDLFFAESENEADLWADPDRTELRVLMLCFAAALAEKGDL